jgi:transcriptional regulator with XRE-family HTH domain
MDKAYPTELKTIGDRLRKRRLDLGLLQREVAQEIGVTKCTIQYWETNRVAPALRFRPRIVSFLGYPAYGGSTPESLAERLRAYREWFGLSRKKLAALLGVDPSNVAGWETEKHRPTKRSLELIDTFLMSNDMLNQFAFSSVQVSARGWCCREWDSSLLFRSLPVTTTAFWRRLAG